MGSFRETLEVITIWGIVGGALGGVVVLISTWLAKTLPKPRIGILVVMIINAALLVGCMTLPLWLGSASIRDSYDNLSNFYSSGGFWAIVMAAVYGSTVGLMTYVGAYLQSRTNYSPETKRLSTRLLLFSWFFLTLSLIWAAIVAAFSLVH
jgi:hypothetical protein